MIYMITLETAFLQAVKNGKKTIEVRTRIPRELSSGDILLIAQKSSHGRVALRCRVSQILAIDPEKLFSDYGHLLYCSHSYYKQHTHGRDIVYAIVLTEIFEFPETITTQSFAIDRAPQWFTLVCPARYLYIMNSALNQHCPKEFKS